MVLFFNKFQLKNDRAGHFSMGVYFQGYTCPKASPRGIIPENQNKSKGTRTCPLLNGYKCIHSWCKFIHKIPIILKDNKEKFLEYLPKCAIPCPSSFVRRPSLTFHIVDFSSETVERDSKKLDRKQNLNVLYQVCVFRADQKNKMTASASDWLRHFRLLLWNCGWNSTKPDRKKGINVLYQVCGFFCFCFCWSEKTRWPPWPIRQIVGTWSSGARYLALWAPYSLTSCVIMQQKKRPKYKLNHEFIFTLINVRYEYDKMFESTTK